MLTKISIKDFKKFMPLTKKLICISAEEVTFPEKRHGQPTGKNVKKWKYVFLREPGTYASEKEKHLIAWDNLGSYKDHVSSVQGWDESKAKYYPFDLTTFQGEVVEKLSSGAISREDAEKE